jgi:hypothetical protein
MYYLSGSNYFNSTLNCDFQVARLEESMGNNETDHKKRSGWSKTFDIFLRSCHIGTASVLLGGVVWTVPFERLSMWHYLTIATGCALIIFNIYKCRHWPYQGSGLMAELHVALFWSVHVKPELMAPLFATALTVGVIGSHMPGALRHWSLVHGRIP